MNLQENKVISYLEAGSMRARARAAVAVLCTALACLMLLGAGAAHADDFLEPEQAFAFSAAMAGPAEIDVHYKIAPKYYMYRERFEFALSPDAGRLGKPSFPKGVIEYDPTFDKKLEIYHDGVTIRVPLQPGAAGPLKLEVTGQGCAEAGLCYSPMTSEVTLTPVAGGYRASGPGVRSSVPGQAAASAGQGSAAGAGPAAGAGASSGAAAGTASAATSGAAGSSVLDMTDTGFAAYLAGAGWGRIVALCLLLGLLLSFTPCVLPMVPILLAIVAGDAGRASAPDSPAGARSRWRGLSLAATYVLGMSLVYTALGVAAGLIGASLAAWLQTPWVLALFALLLALLALAMFDVYTLQAPSGMQSALNDKVSRIPGGRYGGALLMGMVSALIVGPCVAAPLAGVLLFISQTGNLVLGGLALFALAWGEGILLLLVGASSGALLPRAGAWMDGVKHLFGWLLLATAWWMLDSVVPSWASMLGWAFLAGFAAVMLGAFEAMPAGPGLGAFLRKTLGLLAALWAALLLVGAATGGGSLLQPLAGWRAGAAAGAPGVAPAGPGASGVSGAAGLSPDATQAIRSRFRRVRSVQELDAALAQAGRPVMLDFYADWCVSCLEMEKFTFSDPAVAGKMSQLLLLQADVTKNTPEDRALLKRFHLFGPPGILFFDAQGKVLPNARVIGFQSAAQFGAVLDGVLAGKR